MDGDCAGVVCGKTPAASYTTDDRVRISSSCYSWRLHAHVSPSRRLGQFENWLSKQFADAGFSSKRAEELSRFLFAGYHGAILLAHAHSDHSLISSEVTGLKRWLGEVFAAHSI
jgi:hypothetical protein